MASVEVGQEAPNFTLRNENNEEVELASLRGGSVVLVFYPADFSPMCTSEHCGIRDDYSSFHSAGATVLGISRDSTWAHKAFKKQEGLSQSLLSDMKGEVAKLYGCWNADFAIAERLTVVIDPDGIITYVRHNSPVEARDHTEAIAALD